MSLSPPRDKTRSAEEKRANVRARRKKKIEKKKKRDRKDGGGGERILIPGGDGPRARFLYDRK